MRDVLPLFAEILPIARPHDKCAAGFEDGAHALKRADHFFARVDVADGIAETEDEVEWFGEVGRQILPQSAAQWNFEAGTVGREGGLFDHAGAAVGTADRIAPFGESEQKDADAAGAIENVGVGAGRGENVALLFKREGFAQALVGIEPMIVSGKGVVLPNRLVVHALRIAQGAGARPSENGRGSFAPAQRLSKVGGDGIGHKSLKINNHTKKKSFADHSCQIGYA